MLNKVLVSLTTFDLQSLSIAKVNFEPKKIAPVKPTRFKFSNEPSIIF